MVILPKFPKVLTNDDLVIIEYEGGKRLVWGSEGTSEKARIVAERMDVELKLLAYIQETAGTFLDSIHDSITSIADDDVIIELINEALFQWIRRNSKI